MTSGVQVENGNFARIHNEISERLARTDLSGSEFRCLWFLLRKTYGFQKKEDTISYSQFADGTGLERRNAMRSLDKLVNRRIIYRKDNGNNRPQNWGFNKYFNQWDTTSGETTTSSTPATSGQNDTSLNKTSGENDTRTSGQNDTRTSVILTTHKRYKDKERKLQEQDGSGGGDGLRQTDPDYAEICTAIEQNGFGMMTPLIADEVQDLLTDYPKQWILDAMKISVAQNKRTLRYVAGILRKWRADGRDTPKPTTNGVVANWDNYGGGVPDYLRG